ncbi:uncharacterized protein LOC121389462 [Gigantopelta aegis]|uniref:uncharacterized protein LOC121389462 n=1 Tax=Gigantopelta aegis TaxID=1735272 RepID=UPI001B88BFA7|nr:uncharacterized protein LOC121389462 [Gigantopelta aegis]
MFVRDNLLAISSTINACTLTYIVGCRLMEFLSKRYQEKFKCVKHLTELHTRKPWLAGKVLTEQLLLVILCILSVTALGTSSAAELPFVGTDGQALEFVPRLVMCINIGRYVFMSLQDLYLLQHLQNFKTDLIHHVVTVAACSVFLAYEQNIFLSIATPLMEVNLIFLTTGRIMRDVPEYRDSKINRNTTVLGCAVTMVCRGVLPVIFLAIAVKHDSPFSMKVVPLTLFFLCIVFFFVINFWMIFQTASRVVKLWVGDRETQSSTPGTVLNNPTEPQLYDVTIGAVDGQGVAKPFPLSNVNYGFVKSYDNRNLCNNDNEKMNFGMKKLTKHNIITDLTDMVSYSKVPNSPSRVTYPAETDDVLHNPGSICTNSDDISIRDPPENLDLHVSAPRTFSQFRFSPLNQSVQSKSSDISDQSTSSASALVEQRSVTENVHSSSCEITYELGSPDSS